MKRNLKVLTQCIPHDYPVTVCVQEPGSYTLVLRRRQAWLFVPEAEVEETRRRCETTGTVASMDTDARSAQVA